MCPQRVHRGHAKYREVAARYDFEFIIVQDARRLSGVGAGRSAHMRYDLEKAGVEVTSALRYIPRSDYSDIKDAMDAVVAKQQAKGITTSVARGWQSALESGRQAHCALTPDGF